LRYGPIIPAVNKARLGLIDSCVAEFDAALRTLTSSGPAARAAPVTDPGEENLTGRERHLAARLMRVNHAGEIAAQALYRGQALVARDATLRARLLAAAQEEHDHLLWCAARTRELGGAVSVVTPLWYAGSLAIGAAAGMAGDRISLGFLAETERQVTEHLEGHLRRLPALDHRSRDIVARMREEEMNHGRDAVARGAASLPAPVCFGMRLAAKLMTTVAHFL
jgi:3-demethoxyubiquinol 3-hydroxylase